MNELSPSTATPARPAANLTTLCCRGAQLIFSLACLTIAGYVLLYFGILVWAELRGSSGASDLSGPLFILGASGVVFLSLACWQFPFRKRWRRPKASPANPQPVFP